ncbi:hypothetical protein RRG08_064257, partial [Elysia crispata]
RLRGKTMSPVLPASRWDKDWRRLAEMDLSSNLPFYSDL